MSLEYKNIDEMKIEEVIEEINTLYKKSQEEGLTEEEKERQQELRSRYIENVKKNFKSQISGYKFSDSKSKGKNRLN